MTRNARLAKLVGAIREYRGTYTPTGWRHAPRPTARVRVERWLTALALPVEDSVAAIDAFKTTAEMRAWITRVSFTRDA